MLKAIVLSLVLGAIALIVVLTQFFAPPPSVAPEPPTVFLSADTAGFDSAQGAFVADGLKIDPTNARVTVTLTTGGIKAANYPFLHLAIADPPRNLKTIIAFNADGASSENYTLETPSPTSVWLAMNEFKGWQGTVESITLTFVSPASQGFRITDLSLHPPSPGRQLRGIWSDLTSFTPWKRAQMNTHTGVAKVASFYPVPLVMSWLLLSLAVYGLIVLVGKRAFSWTDVGLIFLVCWISLDLVWQKRLTHQVTHSYHTFAGKTTEEKLLSGPDSILFRLIERAKETIDSPNARVFVASDDIYLSMRGAYYLYPLNPYWKLEGTQLPEAQYMREGDYIVLVTPTIVKYNKRKGIWNPESGYHPAKLVFSAPEGKLLRLQ